jgi:hypothetical protein
MVNWVLKNYFYFFILLFIPTEAHCQQVDAYDPCETSGILIRNPKFFEYYAIIVQDPMCMGNTLPCDLFYSDHMNNNLNQKKACSMFTLDSISVINCERRFKGKDRAVKWFGKRKLSRKNIRIYAGFKDKNNQLYAVVQFITLERFIEDEKIFRYQLFLIAGQKDLLYAVVKL